MRTMDQSYLARFAARMIAELTVTSGKEVPQQHLTDIARDADAKAAIRAPPLRWCSSLGKRKTLLFWNGVFCHPISTKKAQSEKKKLG